MTMYVFARILHFVGGVLWMGGVIVSAMVAALGAPAGKAVAEPARLTAVRIGSVGMVVAWAGGLGMLIPRFATHYAHAPWMHAKLTLVFIAAGLSGVVSGSLRRAAAGTAEIPAAKLRGLAIALLAIVAIVVFLAVAQPGGSS